ncbi:MAG: hypothetical protein M3R51_07080 [Candidatus Eremiobacteraeota bacterium]|nr:hypothetical protein [Candidatus Eremiobacteraeota bacterium]
MSVVIPVNRNARIAPVDAGICKDRQQSLYDRGVAELRFNAFRDVGLIERKRRYRCCDTADAGVN